MCLPGEGQILSQVVSLCRPSWIKTTDLDMKAGQEAPWHHSSYITLLTSALVSHTYGTYTSWNCMLLHRGHLHRLMMNIMSRCSTVATIMHIHFCKHIQKLPQRGLLLILHVRKNKEKSHISFILRGPACSAAVRSGYTMLWTKPINWPQIETHIYNALAIIGWWWIFLL